MEDWFSISDVDQIDTPALVVYPQRVKYNLDLLKTHIDNIGRLRPHVKTHKCNEVAILNIEAGINKFKCATIAEAEMLGMCKAKDVLLAYQPIGPKINRLIGLIKQYPDTRYSCLIDNLESAQNINAIAIVNELSIDAYIDINVGMSRSGIHPQDAFELYEQSSKLSNLNVIGLHAYDGHIHDADLEIRTQRCNDSFAPVEKLIAQLRDSGFNPITIVGGTPTFPIHAKRKDVECSPGTFIYWDEGYGKSCKEQEFLPAALVLSRVISLPDETRICVDLGHKSIASENTLDKRVVFLNAPELKPVGHSEEHLVLEGGVGHNYKIGDLVYGLPYHICPTVALYERAIIIENKRMSGEWKTIARDRKINI